MDEVVLLKKTGRKNCACISVLECKANSHFPPPLFFLEKQGVSSDHLGFLWKGSRICLHTQNTCTLMSRVWQYLFTKVMSFFGPNVY